MLLYFRDVEKFTDVYFNELVKTPTGRDPYIRQFMEKWRFEEDLHGELLNRFINEYGYSTPEDWAKKSKQAIPFRYKASNMVNMLLANFVGTRFSAVHMTWGAINEMSTLNGYRRLWTLAKHPVLEYMLRAIAREEASHSFFYHSMAKFNLQRSKFAQDITRWIVCHFWEPVGSGAKPVSQTNYVIQKLFDGKEGIDIMDTFVNGRLEKLPGFDGCKKVTEKISEVVNGPIAKPTLA